MRVEALNLITEVEKEVDSEASRRKRERLKSAIRDLRAAEAVVRKLKDRVEAIASDDNELFA